MQTGYLVIGKDGKDYGPLDRDTIQRWYHEGRLDQNSRVWEPDKTRQSPKRMKNEARFSLMSLEGDPGDLEKGPVKLKLFWESSAEDRYGELFTTIDLKGRKLYLSEKDPEYRGAIIRALQVR